MCVYVCKYFNICNNVIRVIAVLHVEVTKTFFMKIRKVRDKVLIILQCYNQFNFNNYRVFICTRALTIM